jgi:capsid protein
MGSNSAAVLAEILRTTLHLVEQRRDLDQNAPSVSELKDTMRRTIAEVEHGTMPRQPLEVADTEKTSWADLLRRKKREWKQHLR